MSKSENAPKKQGGMNWILWWRIDPAELELQITQYHELPINKSIRGVSFLFTILGAALTAAAVELVTHNRLEYAGVAVMLGLGFLMWRGQRWAMIAGLVAYTAAKIYQVVSLVESGHGGGGIVGLLLWWAIFMHAFYFALRVEQARRRAPAPVVVAASE